MDLIVTELMLVINHRNKINYERNIKNSAKLLRILVVRTKIWEELNKTGSKLVFTSAAYLKWSILCNKTSKFFTSAAYLKWSIYVTKCQSSSHLLLTLNEVFYVTKCPSSYWSYPGMYQLGCNLAGQYISEIKNDVLTRSMEH